MHWRATRRCARRREWSRSWSPKSSRKDEDAGARRRLGENSSAGGYAGTRIAPGECSEAGDSLLRRAPGSLRGGPACGIRDLRPPRLVAPGRFQRSAYPGYHPDDLSLPPDARDQRPALPRLGHPRPVGARSGERARGARGQWGRGHGGRARRLHPDAGDLAGDPRVQPWPHRGARRRHRDHPFPQPAGIRGPQVQPALRWPGRHARHRLDPGHGQRDSRERAGGGSSIPRLRSSPGGRP